MILNLDILEFICIFPTYYMFIFFKSTFTWEAKWASTNLGFQTSVKTSSVHMQFHLGCILKRPDIFIDICRHFISGSVYIIITRREISFLSKRPIWNPYLRWVSNAYALNATPNESALIHFVLGKLCSHENLMPVWDFISVKMIDIESIPFWVSFRPSSCEHK